ncbi:hypothetical protein FRC04_010164 [Tulasnella sp. 424]|nr:hypothetical protein FRC04_010164 [Tulasnella sp. 424]KAG8972570.1 hypothetical protein FRC05_009803 [Tulasnella sp. 425]
MASLTMDYSPMAYEHPHDVVFQQLLQTARLPSASLFRQDNTSKPLYETPHRLQRRRTASSVATRSSSSYDSEADEGYHADKDNGRRKLLKVSCDFFLEITPISSRKTRCHACRTEIPQSTYRLRSIDTSESFHVTCFESSYNLEQGFGRIYPSSFKGSPSGRSADNSDRLDDGARALVKEWKVQRRREGLTEAAGPDTGIPVGIMDWPVELDSQENRGRTGEKRPSVEVEDDFERKRARFARRNTEPWSTSQGVEEPLQVVPLLARTRSTGTSTKSNWRRDDGMPDLTNLPTKLSDALKRLEALPRRFSAM